MGILTNVGEAHLEIMGSRRAIEETKWALFSRGARPVLNAFDEVSRRRAPALDLSPHWFACGPRLPDLAWAQRLTALAGDRRFLDRDGDRVVEREVEVHLPGEHNRANLVAALAGALELGVALDPLLARIPGLALPQGRYDSVELPGGVRLIYDAYNANASATIATLDTFAQEAAARRIAVLASMAELGDESQALHERVGAHAAGAGGRPRGLGEYAGAFARGAREGGMPPERVVRLESNAQACELAARARAPRRRRTAQRLAQVPPRGDRAGAARVSVATRGLAVSRPEVPAGLTAIPVRTRLVRPGDDLVELVRMRCAASRGPATWLPSRRAPSRSHRASSLRPSTCARRRWPTRSRAGPGPLATVNQPESMQLGHRLRRALESSLCNRGARDRALGR